VSETFAMRAKYVTVAVAFDHHTVPLTTYAAGLCEKLGKDLCLLHVVEPWLDQPHSVPQGENDPLWNVRQAVEANAYELAERKLDELASGISQHITVVKHVVRGKPAPVLAQEALNTGSMLLLVGADIGSLKYLPKGLSTALSLMVSSPVPVLVADGKTLESSPGKSPAGVPTIMMADDLSKDTESALEFAFDLAIGQGKVILHHVYVNGLTFEALRAGLLSASATAHSFVNEQTSTEIVFDALVKELEEQLERRCESEREYLENGGGAYESRVLTGHVAKKLLEEVEKIQPSMVVFGRHQAVHRQPFFMGRVPFKTMLNGQAPVVIVPGS
jgi:nucleotide-binding universal stress UspA family protein